ncbi:SseB family protein [uncultured Enterovirga sp.]|uniref:SseB family protein n=1 Tax=uncultured Enterovirga sp. TaxID=2026352 RepID=UPI0035CC2A78
MSASIGSAAFQPQNELEIELVRAAHEPHLRTAFLRGMIDQQVYLALLLAGEGKLEAGPDGQAVIPEGARLEIGSADRGGERALPLFSAPVRAQAFYRQDHVIAPDTVRDIFARHVGARFVLNPGSDYALDLDATDAAAMLRGDYTAH